MAEVSWQARRVSDSVLVDVTAEIEGTPEAAPASNELSGSPASIFYQTTDPGAVGAGAIWLKYDTNFGIQAIFVRNEGDTAWLSPGFAVYGDGYASNPTSYLFLNTTSEAAGALDVAALPGAGVSLSDAGGLVVTGGGNANAVLAVNEDDIELTVLGLSNAASIKAGSADPSAGAGVAAAVCSLYLRVNAGTGTLWLKTGAANTAWAQVTTS